MTLETIGGDRAAQSLAIALQDEDADIRAQAVDALGEIGSPTALQLLEYAWAADTDESVRADAAAWLRELSHRTRQHSCGRRPYTDDGCYIARSGGY